MKKNLSVLLMLLLMAWLLPAQAEGAKIEADWMPWEVQQFFAASAFHGYTIGTSASYLLENTVGGTYFFAVAQKDGYNALYGFRESGGKYQYWLKTDAAIPQGRGQFEVRFYSGELHLLSDQLLNFGESLSVMFIKEGNEEQPESRLFFAVNQNGQFNLKLACYDACWNEALVSSDSIAYYHEGEPLGRAYGVVETNLRYFSWDAFPKTLKSARENLSNPPAIPGGDLIARRIKFTGGQKLEVYSGPGAYYQRGANGKASVSTNDWIQVFGLDNGYVMIQYDISSTQMRIGYIDQSALPDGATVSPLRLEFADAEITAATFLTDDPLGSQARVRNLSAGQKGVQWLATMGPWVYVEITGEGAPIRGFVPASAIRKGKASQYSVRFSNSEYRAAASVSVQTDGSASISVDVFGPKAWIAPGSDHILHYQLYANNVPVGVTDDRLLMPGADQDWWFTFCMTKPLPLPAGTTVLGLCPVYYQSGQKADEMLIVRLNDP